MPVSSSDSRWTVLPTGWITCRRRDDVTLRRRVRCTATSIPLLPTRRDYDDLEEADCRLRCSNFRAMLKQQKVGALSWRSIKVKVWSRWIQMRKQTSPRLTLRGRTIVSSTLTTVLEYCQRASHGSLYASTFNRCSARDTRRVKS
jgi:hypothetical protein